MKQKALNHIVQKEQLRKTSTQETLDILKKAFDIVFTMTENTSLQPSPQMPASKGIKLYGEAAVSAMMKEFKQMNTTLFRLNP